HVIVVGGSRGKSGAAAMTGMAAVRAGAGLVTVASASSAIDVIAAHAPELMTEPLAETASGGISIRSYDDGRFSELVRNKDVLAIGPGLGGDSETVELVQQVFAYCPHPTVVDADGLNALVGRDLQAKGRLRILTPHPGEMSRLTGLATAAIFKDRVDIARVFAHEHGVILVLKGQRTLLAFPDGRVWVNPTGTPALATGGTGDILTGIAAGFLAQFPDEPENAIAAAVYLHGLAGQIGERTLGDKSLAATDLLEYLPEAMRECTRLPD
ncbi:MAG: NAD(P)H-hydrate dehydratase, partial [Bryobacteraceae bacterium]|nr:NAD(P)H-hydrate dehydratase [Bryobacteraceae bacterium]